MNTIDILDRLIAFDTTSRNPNIELINFVSEFLTENGISSKIIENSDGTKANLFATIGPEDIGGVMLSGHTDVVPVDGQNWTKSPFHLTIEDDKLFGRGTADMKGFVACAINAAIQASKSDLKTPLHLALSFDEEIGCIGVRSMIDMLAQAPIRPKMCIVGEPTNLAVASGHKGKIALKAVCRGREGHSALAPLALNALHLGADLLNEIRQLQDIYKSTGSRDADYDIPYTTLHVGKMNGGTALNIVPNSCELEFEIRNVAEDSPDIIIRDLKARANKITQQYLDRFPEADIQFETMFAYPSLNTSISSDVVQFVKSLTGANSTCKVAFGTEGGLFSQDLDIPTVICGPGSMMQGHKPDEYVTIDQIEKCDDMLANLIRRLEKGL